MAAIHFDITGDNASVIKSLQDTLNKLEEVSDVTKRLSDAGIDMSNMETSIKAVEKYVDELGEAILGCSDEISELNKMIADASSNGDSDLVEQYKAQLEVLINVQDELNGEMESAQGALQTLKNSYDDTSDSVEKTSGVMVKLLGGQEKYNQVVSQLPSGLKAVVTGLNGMVGAAKAFIATPLGAVLAALILAYKSVTTWLNKSAEGQQALAKISGYLKGALSALQQIVIDVGRALFNAFSNPRKAISDLWTSLKKDLLERMKAAGGVFVNFGKIIGNAFKGNFKEAGNAAKEMADDWQKVFTGKDVQQIKEGAKALGDRFKSIRDIAKAQSELSARENKLHRDRTAWLTEEAELDKQIAEQRNKMSMGSASERSAAAAKLQELVNQKTEKNVALAREEYEIKKASNALTDSSQEDLDEEERLRAKMIQLETEGINQKGYALRIQDSMNNKLGKTSEKMSELIEKERQLLSNIKEKQGEQALESASLSISAMEEGFDKEMAERENEHRRRTSAIEKEYRDRINKIRDLQKEEYKARHDGSSSGFVFDENGAMVISAKEIFGTDLANEGERYRQELGGLFKKYTDEYKGFLTEWEDLTKKFDNDRKAILASGAIEDNPELWTEITEKEKEAFEKLAESWAKSGRDSGFSKWFEELGQQSLVDLEIMLSDLENDMELFGDSLPDNEVRKLRAQIILLKKAIKDGNYDDETKKLTENAQNATVSWADLNKVLTDTAALFKQAGDAIGGDFGEALKLVGNFTTSVAKIGNAVKAFKEAKNIGDIAGKITSSLTVAGAAVSIASEVSSKIKEARERTKEVDNATKAYYRTLQQINDSKILESFSNAFGTDSYGKFVQSMSIATQAGKSIASISDSISKGTTTIKNWGKSLIMSMAGPIGTLFGIGSAAKKGKTITEDLVSDMRTDWQKFWGSDKNIITASFSEFFDSNGNLLGKKLQEWYKTYGEGLSDANKQIVENMLSEFDRMEDAKSNIRGFLSDMFGNVASDMASEMVDNFIETGNVIRDMSKYMNDFGKSVAKSIVQGKLMAKVFKDEDQDAIADLLAAEKTSEAVSAFNNIMDKAKGMAPEIQAFLTEIGASGWGDVSTESRTASSRSPLGASQDSIDESNGRLTAIQAQVFEIGEKITSFKESYDMLISFSAATLEHTQGIHVDTTELKGMVSEMRELSRSVNRNVSQLADKGVKML